MRNKLVTKGLFDTDWNEPAEIVSFIENLWRTRNTSKYSLEREWYLNVAWYLGHQYLIWDNNRETLVQPPAPSYRVRLVVNKLQPIVRTTTAKIYKARPQWDVMPATTDAEDISLSALQNQLLDYEWYRLDMSSKQLDALGWMLTTGNVFYKVTWDPNDGTKVAIPSESGLEVDELFVGNTQVEVVSPFEIIPAPGHIDIKTMPYILQTRSISKSELVESFPSAKDIGTDNTIDKFKFQDFIKNLTVPGRAGFLNETRTSGHNDDMILVHELWIRPRNVGSLKKGLYAVMAGGKILNGKGKGVPFPYMHMQLPFIHMKEVPVPGRFWGTCTLEQLKPLQADYNRTKSQLCESRNSMSKPKWLVPIGSQIKDSQLTSEPGEVVFHTPTLKPEMSAAPPMPSYVANMLQEHRQDIEDIAGQHEVSNAEAPGQIRSGRGVLALIEQDEARIGPVIQHIEQAQERIGAQLLSLNAQFVDERRLARIVGQNDELLVLSYIGKDLIGNKTTPGINYFDVRIRTSAGLPNSRAAQLEVLSNLVELGVLTGEKDKETILSMLNMGTVTKIVDKSRVHKSRQLLENQQLEQGQPVNAEEWHNHALHLETINDYRNSAKWDTLTPEIQQLFNQHAEMHQKLAAVQVVKPQMLIQQAAAVLGVPPNEGQGQSGLRPQ